MDHHHNDHHHHPDENITSLSQMHEIEKVQQKTNINRV